MLFNLFILFLFFILFFIFRRGWSNPNTRLKILSFLKNVSLKIDNFSFQKGVYFLSNFFSNLKIKEKLNMVYSYIKKRETSTFWSVSKSKIKSSLAKDKKSKPQKDKIFNKINFTKKKGLYDNYIDKLNKKPHFLTTKFDRHHVIPLFDGGKDDSSNIIKITRAEHIVAHLIRYIEFGKNGDRGGAILLLKNKKTTKSDLDEVVFLLKDKTTTNSDTREAIFNFLKNLNII